MYPVQRVRLLTLALCQDYSPSDNFEFAFIYFHEVFNSCAIWDYLLFLVVLLLFLLLPLGAQDISETLRFTSVS
jgi:hypothetical protein